MTDRPGLSLVPDLDQDKIRNIRVLLRKPKRDAPGYAHALHDLWDAYLALERRYNAKAETLASIKRML